MGRQIAICLTRADVRSLDRELRAGEAFCVIGDTSEEPKPSALEGGLEQNGRMAYLVRSEDVRLTRFGKIPGESLYAVDSLGSPVIEFIPSIQSGREMRSGRMFFDTRFYEGDQFVEKSQEFLAWGSWVLQRSKNVLSFDAGTRTFWGGEAARLRDSSQLVLVA